MQSVTFEIEGPIMAWERPQQSGRRRYASDQQEAYQRMVGMLCMAAGAGGKFKRIPAGVPVRLTVRVFYERPKDWRGKAHKTSKPDLSNLIKNIEDGLNGVAWADDSQVCDYGDSGKFYTSLPDNRAYAKVTVTEIVDGCEGRAGGD
jgi:Holliday junction resolvase RusA-like endonuclease